MANGEARSITSKLPAKSLRCYSSHLILKPNVISAGQTTAIRKHGGYLTAAKIDEILNDPDTIIKLATDLKNEREKRRMLELQTAQQTQVMA